MTSDFTNKIINELENTSPLSRVNLNTYLGRLFSKQTEFADFYYQYKEIESWSLEDSIIKNASFSIDQGIGIRTIEGEKTGFSYTNNLDNKSINHAINLAHNINNLGDSREIRPTKINRSDRLYTSSNIIYEMKENEKVNLLSLLDKKARDKDSRVKQVQASLSFTFEKVLICNSEEEFIGDIRPLIRLNLSILLSENGKNEQGYVGVGGRYSIDEFKAKTHNLDSIIDEAIRIASVNLNAVECPSGEQIVVLGNGWPGILLHEAIGHGLEGDFIRKKTSSFSQLLGANIASKEVTVFDDGTLPGERGSLNFDDEGQPSNETILIENGKLVNFMQDKQNANLMNVSGTGNGRRESYAHIPMPRMTNTYMIGQDKTKDEIIDSVKSGIYAPGFSGGQVDITSGKFVFEASEAYLIENGKIKSPVKGAMLIGDGPSVLKRISMVGNDFKLAPGIGICGKDGQSVPVGVGQPTVRIDKLTVGGTSLQEQ